MAVPEGERRPCKMDVFMHELDLVTYTLQITRMEEPCEQRKFLSPYTPHGQILQEFME